MNEASLQEQSPEPARQLDRELLADSKRFGVSYQALVEMSPRARGAMKGRWVNKLRQEAKRRHIDPDEFVAMSEEGREAARSEHPEHPLSEQKRRPREDAAAPAAAKSFEAIMAKHGVTEAPEPSRGPQVAANYDEGLTLGDEDDEEGSSHSAMDEIPPTEIDPRMRTNSTLGVVQPSDNEDLVGWKQPRNLRDVYARYSIGDGQHFIRVERVDPKVYQGIPCAGFLGEIREPMAEAQFSSFYGGRTYSMQVYGPDPKGRRDAASGLPVIKSKTEPFRYTVPLFPPNLAMLPGTSPSKGESTTMMPFAPGFPNQHMPATPADAAMHKTNIDFMGTLLRARDEENKELRRRAEQVQAAPNKDVLEIVNDAGKTALLQANAAAEKREQALQEQIALIRSEKDSLAAKVEKFLEEQRNAPRESPVQQALDFVKSAQGQGGKGTEEEITRLKTSHMEELNRLREGHRDAIVELRARQDEELKRQRERLDDATKFGRESLEQCEKRARERETQLQAQMVDQRREERERTDAAVKAVTDRYEDRMKDLKDAHARELRSLTENHTTRADVTKGVLEAQIAANKERVAHLESELEDAKEEAEKSRDPVQVLKKSEALAEAMGFTKKDDNAPTTAWERFAATAGMGFAKALETANEWVPRAMQARAQGPALPPGAGQPRALPPGQGGPPQQQQQRQVVRQPSRRAVSWATQGSVPIAGQQPIMPPDAPPVQASIPPAPMQPPAPVGDASTAPSMPPPVPQQEMQPPAPQQQPEPQMQQPNGQQEQQQQVVEAALAFRTEVERAINAGFPAEDFATRFIEQFPNESLGLIQSQRPENFFELVRTMPGGADSVILRRDGKKWVDKLWQQIGVQHQSRAAAQQGAQA